jgi:osmoprotectant transport system permease protein
LSAQLALLPEYLTAHLQLSLFALLIGAVVSIPLGVVVTRVSWLEQPVLGVASVIQTIPSLALLAVMVPLLGALQLQSIGYLPAFIGLTLYSVLPILRNTVTGLAGIDPALIEAAQGVGMTPRQQLWRVELPLAMPVVVAGVRTSTVWIVGIATLSTPVGATSLGNYIFTGLQTRNYAAVLMGCVAAAALALLLDGLVWILENGVRRRRGILVTLSLVGLGLLYAYTFASFAFPLLVSKGKVVRIGAKTFTEQYVLSEILSRKIEQDTELSTRIIESLGSTVAFDALVAGDIDLYVDYSGTVWATVMGRDTIGQDRQKVLREIKDWLETEHRLKWIGPLGFENAYVLAVRQEDAERLDLERISDLRLHASDLVIGGDYEFFGRPEWEAISETYGLSFDRRRRMDSSLMYQAADQGDVDVIAAFSTDGRIDALGLKVLEDDRHAIPPYDAIMLAAPGLPEEAVEVLEELQNTIPADEMRRMNRAVDEGRKSPAEAAEEFLQDPISTSGRNH